MQKEKQEIIELLPASEKFKLSIDSLRFFRNISIKCF